jgi:hypothetical protein
VSGQEEEEGEYEGERGGNGREERDVGRKEKGDEEV